MATIEIKKNYIRKIGATGLVKELVSGNDMAVADAVDYVYDMKTLSTEAFVEKYLKNWGVWNGWYEKSFKNRTMIYW